MKVLVSWALALLSVSTVFAAEDEDGYIGYRLEQRGDPEAASYETANTDTLPGVILPEEPDVFLNASVSVGLIDIDVQNITAKVNLDAQVLKLLKINAGVDASIDRVRLTIEDVKAKVELEARLGNVVAMVDDVLSSIDLNPIIATLGQEVAEIVNNTVDGVTDIIGGGGNSDTPGTNATKRSAMGLDNYNLEHNILYSVNDYTGQAHTNRILAQNGDIYDEYLDNEGSETRGRTVVGYYARDMSFTGHNRTIFEGEGEEGKVAKEFELEYLYAPFPGLEVTSWVYVDAVSGEVVRTQVVAEAFGGGTSTVSNDEEL